MNVHIVDLVIIVGCACFACLPLDRRRVRASWANWVFVAVGVVGIAMSVLKVALDVQWIALSAQALYGVHGCLHFIRGLLLGLILSLILSGQLPGTKRQKPAN